MEDQIYAYHAEMRRVFSHPKRLELINTLRGREMSAGELGERLGLAPVPLWARNVQLYCDISSVCFNRRAGG